MNELQAVKSYVNTRINALEREQGQRNWNEKVLNELYDVRDFLNGFECDDSMLSMDDCLAMLSVLDKAEDTFKKQCDCDKD